MIDKPTPIFVPGQDIPQYTFTIEQKISKEAAIRFLLEVRDYIDPRSPIHYNRINIDKGICLYIPGEKDGKHPGDYVLSWNNKYPKHEEITEYIIRNVYESNDRYAQYVKWISILEDIYDNGTLNIFDCASESERIAKQVIFWITLQEDINKASNLGRLRPFCRYAEALATTQTGFKHTYDEVLSRMKVSVPENLDRWELPIMPSFYGWSAF